MAKDLTALILNVKKLLFLSSISSTFFALIVISLHFIFQGSCYFSGDLEGKSSLCVLEIWSVTISASIRGHCHLMISLISVTGKQNEIAILQIGVTVWNN